MTKVIANTTIEFPKLNIVLQEGEVTELPDDSETVAVILASPHVQEVKESKSEQRRRDAQKEV